MSKNEEEKEFENVINGLERANIKYYQFSLLVFYPSGPWKYYNYTVLFLFEIIIVYFLVTGAVTIMHSINHDIFAAFEVTNALLIGLGVFINLADFHFVRKKRVLWYKMLSYCKDEFYGYDCESVKKEMARLRLLSRTYMEWFFNLTTPGIGIVVIFIFIVIPISRYMSGEEQPTNDTAFNVFLPLLWWSTFNTRTITGFIIQYLLMAFAGFYILVIFLVYISTVFYFMMELIIQFKILCFALNKHKERIEIFKDGMRRKRHEQNDSLTTINADEDDVITTEVLIEPIIHHLKIQEFFMMFQEFSSFFFGLVLSFNMLMIVVLSVILTKMDTLFSVDGFKFLSIFIFEVLHIFCITYCGSMVVEESNNVKRSLYSIDWYGFNSNQKKILNIFQIQSASNFLLSASGIYDIDLNIFLQVMQTAYSVYNVFSTIKL